MKEIPLTRGMVALVDDEDYDALMQHKWCATPTRTQWYALRRDQQGHAILMHREILAPGPGKMVDHRNHNGLDNRRGNIRIVTGSQNCYNRKPGKVAKSGYRGVYWTGKCWQASCFINGKQKYLGAFLSPEQGALAWNQAIVDADLAEYTTLNDVPGQWRFTVILGAEERTMLAELAQEDMRPSYGDMIRVLIRREYLRRKAAKYEAQHEQVPA